MGSKVYTETTISDLRQAAEAEVVSGPQSQLAMPGGISAGPSATVSITGTTPLDAGKTFEQMLSVQDSTLGKVLGLTSQLAAGIFETQAGAAAEGAGGIQLAGKAGDYTAIFLIGLLIVGYIFFFGRK